MKFDNCKNKFVTIQETLKYVFATKMSHKAKKPCIGSEKNTYSTKQGNTMFVGGNAIFCRIS